MYVNGNTQTRSPNRCRSGRAVSITCSECVSVPLAIQHATRMRRVLFSSVASVALQYVRTLSNKKQIF